MNDPDRPSDRTPTIPNASQSPVARDAAQAPVPEGAAQSPAIEDAVQAPAAQDAAQTPAIEDVAQSPAPEGAVQAPAAEDATQAPATEDAVQSPVAEDATQAPATEGAVQSPAAQDATQAPAAQDAVQSPAAQDATQAPATQDAVQSPAAQDATQAPATEDPAQSPAAQDATQAPATEGAVQSPAAQGATQAPATEDAAQSPAAQNAAQASATEDPAQSPAAQDATQAPAAQGAISAPADPNLIPITFGGTTRQYFKIYTVNMLLTILTLGIYSAWARVRTRRFFMGHTYIGKHNLDFDARPLSILVSRLLVVAILGGLLYAEITFDLIWSGVGVFLVGTLLLLPVALVRGRSFIARHTLHRTLRFRYRLEYRRAAILYLGYASFYVLFTYISAQSVGSESMRPLAWLVAVLLGFIVILPLLLRFGHRIQIDQLQFGRLRFFHESDVKTYYLGGNEVFWVSIFVTIVFFSCFFIVAAVIESLSGLLIARYDISPLVIGSILGVALGMAIWVYLAWNFALYRAVFTCLYWQSFRIGKDSRIESSLRWQGYAWLLAVNYTLIILSLGFMYPWARVRDYRYVAERLQIRLGPEAAAAYSSAGDDLSPMAGEFADVTGWDFDFGAI